MFEKASRMKIRFASPQGMLNVEDLWDLPLTSEKSGRANLNDIAKELYKQIDDGEISFVSKPTAENSRARLAFEIVKHVIDVRLAENEAKLNERRKAENKQKIAEIIAEREFEDLRSKPVEELKKMLEEM